MTRWLVVGGGAAGCVVAARLSELATNDVTLVEAGPDHGATAGDPGEPVLGDASLIRPSTEVIRIAGTEPQPYVQGFGLGGSSLVNGAVVVGDVRAASVGHDLPLEPGGLVGPVADAVVKAAGDARKVAFVSRAGRRVSAADVYLRPAMGRSNLWVIAGSAIDRLAIERSSTSKQRVLGAITGSGEHIEADHVVLCAGAISSPAILLRSGIDTPGIGQGLQDHVGVALSFGLAEPSLPDVPAIGVTIERPGRQVVVLERLPSRPDMGALIAGLLTVSSVGRVSMPDPGAPPVVELRQLSASADLDGLELAAREAMDLLGSREMSVVTTAAYADDHGTPISELRDRDSLHRWLPTSLGGYHHLAGSCRLGVCLDSTGAVLGYSGLSVADASALPGVSRNNLYLSVIRLAERLAKMWTSAGR